MDAEKIAELFEKIADLRAELRHAEKQMDEVIKEYSTFEVMKTIGNSLAKQIEKDRVRLRKEEKNVLQLEKKLMEQLEKSDE